MSSSVNSDDWAIEFDLNGDKLTTPPTVCGELEDGCYCISCKEFFPMSIPNQEDGTMKCWSCRHGM